MFGWEYDDNPIDDGQASADEATTRAGEQGATVMMEPFDVMDIGRMSVIVDPTGAALCLWEPRGVIGATLVNVPGAMTWNDLVTPARPPPSASTGRCSAGRSRRYRTRAGIA